MDFCLRRNDKTGCFLIVKINEIAVQNRYKNPKKRPQKPSLGGLLNEVIGLFVVLKNENSPLFLL